MKLYRVKEGTKGKLISGETVTDWTVRKDLSFTETVADPISYHNRPADTTNTLHVKLVQQGYALFASDNNPKFVLAVQYEDVGVLA